MRLPWLVSFAAFGVAMAGCGGGSASRAVPSTAAVNAPAKTIGQAKVALTVRIPLRARNAKAKAKARPLYLSTATTGLAVKSALADGSIVNAAWQLLDISSSSGACTTSGSTRTCSVSITAPVPNSGSDEFQVVAYDTVSASNATMPAGNPLSAADVTQTVTLGTLDQVDATLSGIVGQLSTDSPAYSVWAAPGQTSSVAVQLTADDVAGGQISGAPNAFANPLSLSITNNAAFQLTPNAFLPPTTPGAISVAISYTAPSGGGSPSPQAPSATVSVSASPLPWTPGSSGATTQFALNPMTVYAGTTPIASVAGLVAGASPSPFSVSEPTAGTFTFATQNNTANYFALLNSTGQSPLPLGSPVPVTSLNGVNSVQFTVHPLVGTASAGSAPTITITDQSGTVATIAVPVATPTPTPAPTPASNLYLTNLNANSISVVAMNGTLARTITSGLSEPWGIAVDSAGKIYATNEFVDTVNTYLPDGTAAGSFVAGTQVQGISIAPDGTIWTSNNGSVNVKAYSPSGTLLTTITGFSFAGPVAVDLNGKVYVADGTAGRITTYLENGTQTTPTMTISNPFTIAVDANSKTYVSNGSQIATFNADGSAGSPTINGNFQLVAADAVGNIYAMVRSGNPMTGISCSVKTFNQTGTLTANTALTFCPSNMAVH